jgi:hypothetical protein
MRPEPRPCKVCGVEFRPKRRGNARVCSNRCKLRWRRQVRADKWWTYYDDLGKQDKAAAK